MVDFVSVNRGIITEVIYPEGQFIDGKAKNSHGLILTFLVVQFTMGPADLSDTLKFAVNRNGTCKNRTHPIF